MKYVVTLSHADFLLLMAVLDKAEKQGVISWSASDFVCENAIVKDEEVEE